MSPTGSSASGEDGRQRSRASSASKSEARRLNEASMAPEARAVTVSRGSRPQEARPPKFAGRRGFDKVRLSKSCEGQPFRRSECASSPRVDPSASPRISCPEAPTLVGGPTISLSGASALGRSHRRHSERGPPLSLSLQPGSRRRSRYAGSAYCLIAGNPWIDRASSTRFAEPMILSPTNRAARV